MDVVLARKVGLDIWLQAVIKCLNEIRLLFLHVLLKSVSYEIDVLSLSPSVLSVINWIERFFLFELIKPPAILI